MAPRVSVVWSVLALALVLSSMTALPIASAQSTTMVSILRGAGSGPTAAPGYAPGNVTVVIGVNNTVMWTNNDLGVHHTVTPGKGPVGGTWSGGSGDLAGGATYSFTFTVPGNYTYSCDYHSWMAGTVVVKAASTSTVSSTATSTTPEFPAASLALILFVVIAAAMLAAPRLRPPRAGAPSI